VGVSLTLATPQDHLPVDFELYLPECWTDVPARCAEARIPDENGGHPGAPRWRSDVHASKAAATKLRNAVTRAGTWAAEGYIR